MLGACTLLLACFPQVPAAIARPEDEDPARWLLFDRVEVIVNESSITHRRLLRDIARFQRQGRINTAEDKRAYDHLVRLEQIRQKLMVQAGQDLGFDPVLVKTQVNNFLDRRIEEAGGVIGMTEKLQEQRTDSLEERDLVTEMLYSKTWSEIVTGEQPGPNGRPTRDRYVRPGILQFVHEEILSAPDQYSAFGGESPVVAFQELLIDHDANGGAEASRELADELRDLALAGEDFGSLVDRYGATKKDHGMTRIDERAVARGDAWLAAFLARSSPGEISEVYAPRGGAIPAWGIARFIERKPGVAPDFDSPDVQRKLADKVLEGLDAQRIGEELDRLYRAAYVWPPDLDPREPR